MISLWMAGVITALVLAERSDVLRVIGTVPFIGTGSPLTFTYLVCEGSVGWTFFRIGPGPLRIRVMALPVSGKVRKVNYPFVCATLSVR